MSRFSHWLGITIIGSLALSGCNMPGGQQGTASIQTAAAMTVAAQLTEAAPPATATSTQAAFPTLPAATAVLPTTPPTAATSCDQGQFISETVPDDTSFSADDTFEKTWTLKNVGTCSWTPSYALVFVSGDAMDGPAAVALTGNVNPGQTVTVSASLKAPSSNGTYHGNWGLRNAAGVVFSSFWVQIKVGGGGGGAFAVTHVTYTYSRANYANNFYKDCPTVTAHITTNGAGDVMYHETRSDGSNAPVQTLHFAGAGTKDVEFHWQLPTAAGTATRWIGIYIDEPNHQDFGHKNFDDTCSTP